MTKRNATKKNTKKKKTRAARRRRGPPASSDIDHLQAEYEDDENDEDYVFGSGGGGADGGVGGNRGAAWLLSHSQKRYVEVAAALVVVGLLVVAYLYREQLMARASAAGAYVAGEVDSGAGAGTDAPDGTDGGGGGELSTGAIVAISIGVVAVLAGMYLAYLFVVKPLRLRRGGGESGIDGNGDVNGDGGPLRYLYEAMIPSAPLAQDVPLVEYVHLGVAGSPKFATRGEEAEQIAAMKNYIMLNAFDSVVLDDRDVGGIKIKTSSGAEQSIEGFLHSEAEFFNRRTLDDEGRSDAKQSEVYRRIMTKLTPRMFRSGKNRVYAKALQALRTANRKKGMAGVEKMLAVVNRGEFHGHKSDSIGDMNRESDIVKENFLLFKALLYNAQDQDTTTESTWEYLRKMKRDFAGRNHVSEEHQLKIRAELERRLRKLENGPHGYEAKELLDMATDPNLPGRAEHMLRAINMDIHEEVGGPYGAFGRPLSQTLNWTNPDERGFLRTESLEDASTAVVATGVRIPQVHAFSRR